jgi:hypothetical protein
MDLTLAAVTGAVISEGIKFLYKQAGELLTSWRKRRDQPDTDPPRALEPPEVVHMENARPVEEPKNREIVDQLQELEDMAERVKDGEVDPDSPEGRATAAALREMLEPLLRTPISFAGEGERSLTISDIEVKAREVVGRLTGLRADLAKLTGKVQISKVRAEADKVDQGGEVMGVDLI